MTSKQYYKQTSDMAFLVDKWNFDQRTNTLHAEIKLENSRLPEPFLNDNDFFAIKDFNPNTVNCNTNSIKFNVKFIINPNHTTTYDLNVCDTINCRIGGGEFVLSCDDYTFVEDVDNNKTDKNETDNDVNGDGNNRSLFGYPFPNRPLFPSNNWFDDWGLDIEKQLKDIENNFNELRKSGSMFYSTTYSMDGDGNGYYRRVDNDGVVEKRFKKVDGELKEVENRTEPAKNIEIKDEGINDPCCTPQKKTELKDLLK